MNEEYHNVYPNLKITFNICKFKYNILGNTCQHLLPAVDFLKNSSKFDQSLS